MHELNRFFLVLQHTYMYHFLYCIIKLHHSYIICKSNNFCNVCTVGTEV